jgi:hypothetical protein
MVIKNNTNISPFNGKVQFHCLIATVGIPAKLRSFTSANKILSNLYELKKNGQIYEWRILQQQQQ